MDVFVVPAETKTISLSENNKIETGVEDITVGNEELRLFPNPVEDQVTIVATSHLENVEILSADGKIVKSVDVDDNSITVNVGELNKGIYVVRAMGKTVLMLKK